MLWDLTHRSSPGTSERPSEQDDEVRGPPRPPIFHKNVSIALNKQYQRETQKLSCKESLHSDNSGNHSLLSENSRNHLLLSENSGNHPLLSENSRNHPLLSEISETSQRNYPLLSEISGTTHSSQRTQRIIPSSQRTWGINCFSQRTPEIIHSSQRSQRPQSGIIHSSQRSREPLTPLKELEESFPPLRELEESGVPRFPCPNGPLSTFCSPTAVSLPAAQGSQRLKAGGAQGPLGPRSPAPAILLWCLIPRREGPRVFSGVCPRLQ